MGRTGIQLQETCQRKPQIQANEKLEDHLKDLKQMMDEINSHSMTATIKASRHAIRILYGLSENQAFKNVISSLYTEISKDHDDVNIDNVTTRLVDECKLFDLDAQFPRKIITTILSLVLP
jgi:hypothetical protein